MDRRAPGGVTSSNDVDKLASDLLSIEEVGELLGGELTSCASSVFCFFSAKISRRWYLLCSLHQAFVCGTARSVSFAAAPLLQTDSRAANCGRALQRAYDTAVPHS